MSIFGPNLTRLFKKRTFRKSGITSFFNFYYALTLYTKLEKSNERILKYREPKFDQKNLAPAVFSSYGCLTSWKKTEKMFKMLSCSKGRFYS